MGDLVRLGDAAASTGKSELAIRRLITAGKIPVKKDGATFLVDLDLVRAYYADREAQISSHVPQQQALPKPLEGATAIPIKARSKPVATVTKAKTAQPRLISETPAPKKPAVPRTNPESSNGVLVGILSGVIILLVVIGAYLYIG